MNNFNFDKAYAIIAGVFMTIFIIIIAYKFKYRTEIIWTSEGWMECHISEWRDDYCVPIDIDIKEKKDILEFEKRNCGCKSEEELIEEYNLYIEIAQSKINNAKKWAVESWDGFAIMNIGSAEILYDNAWNIAYWCLGGEQRSMETVLQLGEGKIEIYKILIDKHPERKEIYEQILTGLQRLEGSPHPPFYPDDKKGNQKRWYAIEDFATSVLGSPF